MSLTIKAGDPLKDGRVVMLITPPLPGQPDAGSYNVDKYVALWVNEQWQSICTSDASALCNTFDDWTCSLPECIYGPSGMWTVTHNPPPPKTPVPTNTGDNLSGLAGLIQSIKDFVNAIALILSGQLINDIDSAAQALTSLSTTLSGLLSTLTNETDVIATGLRVALDQQNTYLQALDSDIKNGLVTAVNNNAATIERAINGLSTALTDEQKSISSDIQSAVQVVGQSIVQEGKSIEDSINASTKTLKTAITDAGNTVSLAIATPLVGLDTLLTDATTTTNLALSGINTELSTLASEIGSAETMIGTNIIKILAIVTAALAVPAIAEFDKVKGFFAHALEWLITQQMDVSRRVYEGLGDVE